MKLAYCNKRCPAPSVLTPLLGKFLGSILLLGLVFLLVLCSHSGSEEIAPISLLIWAYLLLLNCFSVGCIESLTVIRFRAASAYFQAYTEFSGSFEFYYTQSCCFHWDFAYCLSVELIIHFIFAYLSLFWSYLCFWVHFGFQTVPLSFSESNK